MTRPRFGLWLPVLGAALVSPLFATPALAQPLTAAELRDLPPNHWAYRAVQQLVERYGVMGGYPDATFRGDRAVSRYELAAVLAQVMQRMDKLSAGAAPVRPGAPARPAELDRATLEKLKSEFRAELVALEARVKTNEGVIAELSERIKGLSNVKVTGDISTLFADETLDVGKDRSAPFITSGFGFNFGGDLSPTTSFSANLGGTVKAAGSGDRPGVMGGGPGPTDTNVRLYGARYNSKIGATTVRVGRFGMNDVGTDLGFRTGSFLVGVGEVGPNASQLRSGGDIGAAISSELGAVKVFGGLNSNILLSTLEFSTGPFRIAGGYETDHAAITQNLFNAGSRIKTTDNAALVVDIGGEGPFGATLQANVTNLALTQYGGGVRAGLGGVELDLMGMFFSPPDQSVTVLSFGGLVALPGRPLFGPLSLPRSLIAVTDNYTLLAPPRADNRPTTGPGGQALGKNAGLSIQFGLDNPIIPNLVAEYNVQAKLIENVFLPNPTDPITSESILLRSRLSF